MVKRLFTIFIIILQLATVHVLASGDYVMKSLSVTEGLSHSRVTAVLCDQRGFVWIGTRYGLNRFDGSDLKHIVSDGSSNGFTDNIIYTLREDARDGIWIATEEGLNRYDLNNASMRRYRYRGEDVEVRGVLVVEDGILFGSDKSRIYKYEYSTDSLRLLPVDGPEITELIINILPWDGTKLLMLTLHKGFYVYDTQTHEFGELEFVSPRQINSAVIDTRGRLWVSDYGNGVRVYERDGRLYKHITIEHGLSDNIVTDMAVCSEGVYVGTEKGVNLFDFESGMMITNPFSTAIGQLGSVSRLYADSNDNLYVGSVRNGLLILQSATMTTFRLNPWSMFENCITCLYPGGDGTLWCSIDGDGIVKFDTHHNTWQRIESTAGMKVLGMQRWDDDNIIFSTYGEPFRLVNRFTGKLTPAPEYLNHVSFNARRNVVGYWIYDIGGDKMVAMSDSVYLVDRQSGTVQSVFEPEGLKQRGKENLIHIDSLRVLTYWYKSVHLSDLVSMQMSELVTSPDGKEIRCGRFDGQETVYFATSDHIYIYNMRTGQIREVDMGPLENIGAMLLDNGNLWIGASNMLFMTDGEHTFSFDDGDGVVANEFNALATYVDDEFLYLGGTNGLARVNRTATDETRRRSSRRQIRVSLSDVLINGVSAMSRIRNGHLLVPAEDAIVTLRVVVKEDKPLRSRLYRYYLGSIGDGSPFQSMQQSIFISDLPSGKDVPISVQCTLPDGSWSSKETVLVLDVEQVVWRSWWFITAMVTLAVVLLCIALRVMKQQRLAVASRHRERQLERDVQILANINDSLRSPVSKAAAPLNEVLRSVSAGSTVSRDNLEKHLEESLASLGEMQSIIDNPLGMLHPQNASIEPIMLTARFNVWLSGQVSAFVKAQRVRRRISLDLRPDTDPGMITFNASRMEIVLSCMMGELVRSGCSSMQVSITESDIPGCITVTISDADAGDERLIWHDGNGSTQLKLMYANWLAELDGASVRSATTEDGRVAVLEFTFNTEKYAPHANDASTGKLHRNIDKLSDCTLLVAGADHSTETRLRDRCSHIFQHVVMKPCDDSTIDWVTDNYPDVVVVDASTGSDESIALCQRIKSNIELSSIPVVMLTSGNSSMLRNRLTPYSADAYIEKPFDVRTLIAQCATLISAAEM